MRKEFIFLLLLSACIRPEPEVYFCPRDSCDSAIIRTVDSAHSKIYCAIYIFTLDTIADALVRAGQRGVDVKLVIESQQAQNIGAEYPKLKLAGVNVKLDSNPALMHHKFCIVDDAIVITGSYNWSDQATNKNNENLLILHNQKLATKYNEEFSYLWTEAG